MADHENPYLSHRKVRDQSIALVIVGTVLLIPPVAAISLIDGNVGGIPFPLLYVFVVWILLIAGAAAISRTLQSGDDSASTADTSEPED